MAFSNYGTYFPSPAVWVVINEGGGGGEEMPRFVVEGSVKARDNEATDASNQLDMFFFFISSKLKCNKKTSYYTRIRKRSIPLTYEYPRMIQYSH